MFDTSDLKVTDLQMSKYQARVFAFENGDFSYDRVLPSTFKAYDTYEEAREAGFMFCLNQIELEAINKPIEIHTEYVSNTEENNG